MFDTNVDITIWNRWKDPNDKHFNDVFFRFVIPVKCKFKTEIIKGMSGDGTANIANSQIVIIPWTETYTPPEIWNKLSASGKKTSFTLKANDIVALGVHTFEITNESYQRETDLKLFLAPNVLAIKSIQHNTRSRLGKHWRIEGV